MKVFKIITAVLVVLVLSGFNPSETMVVKPNKSEKKLAQLLKGYTKTGKVKLLKKEEVIAFTKKKKLNSKNLKITKVGMVTYFNEKKESKTMYVLEGNGKVMFMATANLLDPSSVSSLKDDGEDCEIITESCGGDDCSCYCVVSNSCDDSTESNPNCCSSCSCEDGFKTGFDNFMQTLAM